MSRAPDLLEADRPRLRGILQLRGTVLEAVVLEPEDLRDRASRVHRQRRASERWVHVPEAQHAESWRAGRLKIKSTEPTVRAAERLGATKHTALLVMGRLPMYSRCRADGEIDEALHPDIHVVPVARKEVRRRKRRRRARPATRPRRC